MGDLHVLPVDSSHLDSVVNRTVKEKKKKTSFKSHVSRSWISFEEQLTAVENLIRRCHNVGNLSDRSQDVHINTQMLNGWRMSEWKVAAAAAKIHSSRKPTQVHTPGTATGSWHALTCTWHYSLQADVNPGHRWLHQSEQTFFHLISVFWKCCRSPHPPEVLCWARDKAGSPKHFTEGIEFDHAVSASSYDHQIIDNFLRLSNTCIGLTWLLPHLLPHVARPATSP